MKNFIISLLIGIALDKGQIRSIDAKVLDYFPDYKVKRGEKTIYDVTIKHSLTMRSPYKCKGRYAHKQIISSKWIEEMTNPRMVESNNFRGLD